MKKIYLDHAATTPLDKKVLEAMRPYLMDKFGNASSLHSFGREAKEGVEKARKIAANLFGCGEKEIFFTSGATESNNWALKGVVEAYREKHKKIPHIITTAFEHHCVLETCEVLESRGLAEVSYVAPRKDGIVRAEDIKKAIQPNTILVSVMYVNNEIGTVQPIAKIGKLIKKYNILIHTDATQAINYFNCNIKKLGVDLLTMSAHKIYGPKGVGLLYIRKRTPIRRIQNGGGQESGMRGGTLNSPGIVGLGAALQLVKSEKLKVKSKLEKLRNYFIEKVLKEIPGTRLNGSKINRSPNNVNISFSGVEGESLLLKLDAAGVAVSTGSACSSGSLFSSHVLISLGMKPEEAHGSLRFSLGKHNTKTEIDHTVRVLKKIVRDLRKVSGNVLEDYYNRESRAKSSE